jgi:hypothetical protein
METSDLQVEPGRPCELERGRPVEPPGGAAYAGTQYSSHFVPVSRLRAVQRTQMAQLYLASYEATSESLFLRDLEGKDEALLLYAGTMLVGFTTLRVFAREWCGERRRVIYSGDTVVERRHWGQQTLAFAWIRRAGELARECPAVPLYWFLLVKGHRTYRFLPAFARSFHPHWQHCRVDLKPFADALALEMFADDYNPSTGVVEFEPSRGQLRPDIAEPTGAAGTRADVDYFLARNPGYRRGHELVCLCELEERNLKPLARRLFRRSGDAA